MRRIIQAICSVVAMSFIAFNLVAGPISDGEKIQTNSIGMRFVLIPAGEFMMGARQSAESVATNSAYSDEPDRVVWHQDEHPLHQVTISRPFYLQETEVTVAQFRRFVSDTGFQTDAEKEGWTWTRDNNRAWTKNQGLSWQSPGFSQTDNEPVVYISWNDAAAFVAWLNNKENTDRYSLPTEAQWEYACRAGTETPFYYGTLPDGGNANFRDGSYSRAYPKTKFVNRKQEDGFVHTAPVASYPANPFGLYDMSGNAYEWCSDWYGEYAPTPVKDPQGPTAGTYRMLRGGSWNSVVRNMRSANRRKFSPDNRDNHTGFRVAKSY